MKLSTRIFLVAGAAMFMLPAAAEPNTRSATTKVTASGIFKLHGSFTANSALPARTPISASFYLSTNDATFSDNSSISAQATVVGGKINFSAVLPYSWLLASRAPNVTVTLSLSGDSNTAKGDYSYNDYLTKTIPLPKNGATTTINFSGSL